MTQDRMYLKGDDEPQPTPAPARPRRVSVQGIVDALAGRRIAVGADQDDARRELRACSRQLAAAMAQIADMGRELQAARGANRRAAAMLAEQTEEGEKFKRLFVAEQLETKRLIAQSVAAFGRTIDPPPGLRTPAASDDDRRALYALTDQLALLEDRRVLGQPVEDLGEIRRGLTVLAEHAPDLAMDLQQAAARLGAFLRGER